jgi:hypothetical protein
MTRPFDWRDVSLVKTMADDGVCLDSGTSLTEGCHPLQNALLAYLMPMAGPPTYIWRGSARQGNGRSGAGKKDQTTSGGRPAVYGQLRHRAGAEHARLLYMAPLSAVSGNGWQHVLERLAVEAGQRRAQNLLADVHEKSPAYDALREAGFAIYARQSIWRLEPGAMVSSPVSPAALRAATRSDVFAVQTLYSNVVPRLVQQVEPGPRHIERGYVLEESGEMLAYLDVRRGPAGIWVEPVLHPEAYDLSEAVLQACLQVLSGRKEKPLYVCVRRYQHWLQEVVKRAGFETSASQAVMVKRLALRRSEPVLKPISVVEGHVATPIRSAQFKSPEVECRGGPSNEHRAYRWQKHAKTNYRRFRSVDEGHSDPYLREAA